MPQADATIYDVAIAGYGPAGATLANLLAKYGLRIAVVDQAAGIYGKPRAITIDHEVLRVFQACGLQDTIAAHTAPHPGTHYLGVDGGIIKKFDPMPPPFPLGWPRSYRPTPDLGDTWHARPSVAPMPHLASGLVWPAETSMISAPAAANIAAIWTASAPVTPTSPTQSLAEIRTAIGFCPGHSARMAAKTSSG